MRFSHHIGLLNIAENGLEGLREKTRRKPSRKNGVAPEIEEAVVTMLMSILPMGKFGRPMNCERKGSWFPEAE